MATMDDLSSHVLVAPQESRFITSDNPVFKYNPYCEGIPSQGVTGTTCSGFVAFFPISPQIALCLFDSNVYKVGTRASRGASQLTPEDVDQINRMQFVGAGDNVYSDSCPDESWFSRTAKACRSFRRLADPLINMADE